MQDQWRRFYRWSKCFSPRFYLEKISEFYYFADASPIESQMQTWLEGLKNFQGEIEFSFIFFRKSLKWYF